MAYWPSSNRPTANLSSGTDRRGIQHFLIGSFQLKDYYINPRKKIIDVYKMYIGCILEYLHVFKWTVVVVRNLTSTGPTLQEGNHIRFYANNNI